MSSQNGFSNLRVLGLMAALLVGLSAPATSQTFGKNKVQYDSFTWYYIQTSHFDIYFSDGGKDIAEFAAHAAEDALEKVQKELGYQITNRIPFILYNSHNDFQQTNVVSAYMEEGIGGVTELFKNRIVLPFEGNYRQFRHVIHHELVHAVLNDMFYGGSIQTIIANNIRIQLPLWLNEGLAEYLSLDGWDTNSDMFLRDAATSNYLPPIPYLGGYFAYRGGQSVWWYIAEKYGKQKVGEIMQKIRNSQSVDGGFKAAIGLSLEELSERWMKEQKVLYWPDVAKRTACEDYSKRLTNHTKLNNFYNTSPAISPSGDRIAFISDRDDFFGIYVMSASDETKVDRIILGQTSRDFEELHLLTPGITWSPDGTRIAFSAKAGANDAIYVVNVESKDQDVLPVSFDGIHSVEWSPDGNRLVFIGNSSKQSDVWVYDFTTRQAERLTDDLFTDAQPSWSPDGTALYFVSDRGDKGLGTEPPLPAMHRHDGRQMDLYRLSVATRRLERLTATPDADESYPTPAPDGTRLLFISDRNGINNIYTMDLVDGNSAPLTNSLSGVYQISLSRDGNKLTFASMYEAGFDIFLLKSPLTLPRQPELEPTEFIRRRRLAAAPLPSRSTDSVATGASSEVMYSDGVSVTLGETSDARSDSSAAEGSSRLLFDPYRKPAESSRAKDLFRPRNSTDEFGQFVVNKYRITFSADLIYGNAGYDAFYGVLGTTQFAFSDMLGDQQILFMTNLIGDIKNSDLGLAYYYLPDRIDWGFQAFQSARFLYGSGLYYYDLYRYRQYGGGISALYPIDKFNRIDGSLTWMMVTQENLDNPNVSIRERSVILPNVGYVHDNSRWGTWAPVKGTRYEFRLLGSPGIGGNSLTFASITGDIRQYYKFWEDASLVLRLTAGGSFGRQPQRFFIGGTENWINRTFETGRVPISSEEDFAFLTAALPLRGYNYNARIATRFALGNVELRFPVVKYFLGGFLPYILQTVNGAIFVDVGTAVDEPEKFKAYARDANGDLVYHDLLVGTGFGLRMWFLGFPLKFDTAWAYQGAGFSTPKFYFSIGAEF